MSEQVNTEQTKDANQEKSAELSDDQLKEAAGSGPAHGAEDPIDALNSRGTDGSETKSSGWTWTTGGGQITGST